jgi:tetratricopeptide (TPR) repeat protein
MKLTPLSTSSSESERNPAKGTLLSDTDRRAVAEIAVTLDASKHGCIYFAVCNNRLKIEAVEAALAQALSPHGMGTERVVLAERDASTEPPTYRVLIPDLFDYFDHVPPQASGLYLIHGLPELIRAQTGGDNSKVAPISQLLNFRRELFHDRSLYALFWLDPETVPYLMQKAPDFWSFRSGMAQFADATEALGPRDASGWQQSAPSGRWSGDLEEKLRQLAVYRKKTPPDENAIANLLLDIGRLHVNRHEAQEAFDTLHEAEDIFARLGLQQGDSQAKTWLSRAYQQTGQLEKAEESTRQAMEIDQKLQNETSLGIDYSDLSQIYKARGQLEEAERRLREAIEIAERQGDESNLAVDYNNLSQIYYDRGRFEEAERWLRKAIEIAEKLGDVPSLAIRYNNLSMIYNSQGRLEEAEKWLRKAIEIAERLGDELKLAISYNNLSQICQSRGRLEEAEKWLRMALNLIETKGPSATLETLKSNLEQFEREKKQQTPLS